MTRYNYRSYAHGDEFEINKMYEEITGRRRNIKQFQWQWLNAPGGVGEIWLIEATEKKGKKKLIAHHGVMPIRFSNGEDDLLFGKTENTFVNPEYRNKILYPRFEGRFRNHYEQRFHALFSTTGPVAAIRQRLAQGYHPETSWVTYLWAVSPIRAISCAAKYYLQKYGLCKKDVFQEKIKLSKGLGKITFGNIRLVAYNDIDSKKLGFFQDFWPAIRKNYTITPSRGYEDLNWRFWDNPNVSYITLMLDSDLDGAGVAVLHKYKHGFFVIDDYFIEQPNTKAFARLLKATLRWAALCGAGFVLFTTTGDSIDYIGKNNLMLLRGCMNVQPLLNKMRKTPSGSMLRKVCRSGVNAGVENKGWYITNIVAQGVY